MPPWWDQRGTVADNIANLACRPGAPLRTEAEFILATDGATSGLAKQILGAIAAGKNRHSEIVESVSSARQVTRVLDNLEHLRLVERVIPVTTRWFASARSGPGAENRSRSTLWSSRVSLPLRWPSANVNGPNRCPLLGSDRRC